MSIQQQHQQEEEVDPNDTSRPTIVGANDDDDDDDDEQEEETSISINLRVVFDRSASATEFEFGDDSYLVPGFCIAKRYRVVGALGHGAYSKVFDCVDTSKRGKGERVAIKMIRNDEAVMFQASLNELRVLHQVTHGSENKNNSRVVKLLDAFYWQSHLFLAVELLEINLYDVHARARLDQDIEWAEFLDKPGNIQRILRQVFEGLEFLNKNGFLHGDLKPENIAVKDRASARVKLIDFGCCGAASGCKGDFRASLPYRPVEGFLGLEYDHRFDVWSAGAIAYELVTGRVLFEAKTAARVIARIASLRGPVPRWMLEQGEYAPHYFRGDYLYDREGVVEGFENEDDAPVQVLFPRPCRLAHRLPAEHRLLFADFLEFVLDIDPRLRPSTSEALQHEWLLRGG
jgi:serine/threonine protein kinase